MSSGIKPKRTQQEWLVHDREARVRLAELRAAETRLFDHDDVHVLEDGTVVVGPNGVYVPRHEREYLAFDLDARLTKRGAVRFAQVCKSRVVKQFGTDHAVRCVARFFVVDAEAPRALQQQREATIGQSVVSDDAPGASHREDRRPPERRVGVGLQQDHPDHASAGDRIVCHRSVARLEDVQR